MSENPIHHCRGDAAFHKENHLCQIILRKDLGRIKRLVRDTRFFCKNCGRAAREKDNLCNPSRT